MAEEIKPCPFCDGKGYVICGSSFKFGFTSYAVECEKCGAVGAVKASEQEAIETWNTRAESVRRIEDSDLPKTSMGRIMYVISIRMMVVGMLSRTL